MLFWGEREKGFPLVPQMPEAEARKAGREWAEKSAARGKGSTKRRVTVMDHASLIPFASTFALPMIACKK